MDGIAIGGAQPFRVLIAACLGTVLEWYDFFLYSTASALFLGPLFFPKSNPEVGTLLAFVTFGVGFAARPFGGLIFGTLGDRWGRKPVLVITLLTIGIATTTVGLLPSYQSIGIWAPIALVALRTVQGLGAGAEYGGAVILLVEYAPPHRRGLWGGFAPFGVTVGSLLAAGAFAAVTTLPHNALMSWGWRLPFLGSSLLVLLGIYVRLRVMETPVFREAVERRHVIERNPILAVLRQNPRNFFIVVGSCMGNATGYLFPVFGLHYVTVTLGVPRSSALSALMLSFALEAFAVIGWGALSDRIGRRPVYMFGTLAAAAMAFPFFWMVDTRQWIWIATAFFLMNTVVTAAILGPQASFFAELFPPQRRFAGFAVAREIGTMLAAGPAPFVSAALLVWSGGAWWPVATYAAVLAGIATFSVWCGPETSDSDIAETVLEQAETMPALAVRMET